ncbi:MAG: hypothetical protein IT307_10700 [Chloroflexi bacterium]|nr:hypothetical protein [Chloroflexota bacterium]
MAGRNPERVKDEGQVSLPAAMSGKLGPKMGDLGALFETPEVALITPQQVTAKRTVGQIGQIQHGEGVSLGELIDAGTDIWEVVPRDRYGEPGGTQTASGLY